MVVAVVVMVQKGCSDDRSGGVASSSWGVVAVARSW